MQSAATVKVYSQQPLPTELAEALQERVQSGTLKLPLLPAVPMEVSRLASSEKNDVRAIADVIQRDQSMAAHLLRLANSPLYRGKVPMVTVQQAVARLGSSRIREAAMMIACQAGVFRVAGFEREVRSQFQHSIACALFAQAIARQRRANVEEAFLAGLMHDVGRPMLLQALIDLQQELGYALERETVLSGSDQDHTTVGAALGRAWDMSRRITDTIEQHHSSEPLPSCSELVRTVQLADALAHHLLEPDTTPLESVTGHAALAALEIYPDALADLLSRGELIGDVARAIG